MPRRSATRSAVEEVLLEHSPVAHVRRPRLGYESHAVGLDRNELGALLVAAGLGGPAEHALISLLAINGLRVSEATGANIEAPGGHRTLVLTRKGGKIVTIPLAPRTARAIDLAVGSAAKGRFSWPLMAGGWIGMAQRAGAASIRVEPGRRVRVTPGVDLLDQPVQRRHMTIVDPPPLVRDDIIEAVRLGQAQPRVGDHIHGMTEMAATRRPSQSGQARR